MQRMELCGRCAEKMRSRHLVRLVNRPINHKITCECCQLRRYGGTYDVEPKKEREKTTGNDPELAERAEKLRERLEG